MTEQLKNPIMQRMEGVGIGYYGVQRHIMSATHFKSKVDGSSVEISLIDKAVLHYLIDQVGHKMNQGQPLVASMTKIAVHLALNDRTVGRSVAKLIKHGVVKATKKSAAIGYEYHDVDVNQQFGNEVSAAVVERMKPNPIKASVKPVEAIATPKPSVGVIKATRQPVQPPSPTAEFDEFDCELPFG